MSTTAGVLVEQPTLVQEVDGAVFEHAVKSLEVSEDVDDSVLFGIRFDGQCECRVIEPQYYIIYGSDEGAKCNDSFLTLRLVPEHALPKQAQRSLVGLEVRLNEGESVTCKGEYVEFELLSPVNDTSKPLFASNSSWACLHRRKDRRL